MRQNILSHLFASAWLCGSASKWALKHGTGEAPADRSQGYHSEQSLTLAWSANYYLVEALLSFIEVLEIFSRAVIMIVEFPTVI